MASTQHAVTNVSNLARYIPDGGMANADGSRGNPIHTFFGPSELSSDNNFLASDNRMVTNYVGSKAYEDSIVLLKESTTGLVVRSELTGPLGLPPKLTNDRHFETKQWVFPKAMAPRRPYEGVSRMLQFGVKKRQWHIIQYGLMIKMEHYFMFTPSGRSLFMKKYQAVINAFKISAHADILVTFMGCREHDYEWERLHGVFYQKNRGDIRKLAQLRAKQRFCLQKGRQNARILAFRQKRLFSERGEAEPRVFWTSPHTEPYLNGVASQENYSEGGPAAIARRERDPFQLRNGDFPLIVKTTAVSYPREKQGYFDPLVRQRLFGNYYTMFARFHNRPDLFPNAGSYRSFMRTVRINDWNLDSIAPVTLMAAFENCLRWSNERMDVTGFKDQDIAYDENGFKQTTFGDLPKRFLPRSVIDMVVRTWPAGGVPPDGYFNGIQISGTVKEVYGSIEGPVIEEDDTLQDSHDVNSQYLQQHEAESDAYKKYSKIRGSLDGEGQERFTRYVNNKISEGPEAVNELITQFDQLGSSVKSKQAKAVIAGMLAPETEKTEVTQSWKGSWHPEEVSKQENFTHLDPETNQPASKPFTRDVSGTMKDVMEDPKGLYSGGTRSYTLNTAERAFLTTVITKGNLKWMIDNNVYFPFNFILFRPFQEVVTTSGIVTRGGSEVGNLIINDRDVQMTTNIKQKIHWVHVTMNMKAVITNPLLVSIADDIAILDYVGGRNNEFFTLEDLQDLKGERFDLEPTDDRPSLISHMVPITFDSPDKLIDIRGYFDENDKRLRRHRHFPGAEWLEKKTGFGTIGDTRYFDPEITGTTNTWCWRGHQRDFDPISKKWSNITVNEGDLGRNIYSGMVDDIISGMEVFKEQSYNHQYQEIEALT